MKVFESIEQLVGKTPLLEIKKIEREEKLFARVLVKLEYLNPAGSVKDRVALEMLNDAEKSGKIKASGTIIEPTSGNTGIGLSAIAIPRGYKVVLTMPETMSLERRKLLSAYGAEIVLTDGSLGMDGAIKKAKELNENIPNSIILGQFENEANKLAHYNTTGPEIWNDTDGNVDFFVAGIGTGGTLSGTGKYLKENNPKIQVVGVEPKSSPLITEGKSGAHKIQGIGANFIPKNFDERVCDKVVSVSDENAYFWARKLAKREGVLVGVSAGASLCTAIELAKKQENKGKIIVAILPDTGDRYLSTDLF
ncbi:MAG: cysteine synthase A [Clostridiales bacterium]|nr:cysteine synthase A [Clostridiales bacterium]